MLGAQRGPPLHLQDGWLRVASSQERVDVEGQDPSGRAQQSQERADPQDEELAKTKQKCVILSGQLNNTMALVQDYICIMNNALKGDIQHL